MFAAFHRWRKKESGFSTAALVIIGMPLLVGAFGLGFDSVRAVYIKEYLQGRADLATQAAVAISYTNPGDQKIYLGTPTLGTSVSTSTANSLYIQNTVTKRQTSLTASGFLAPRSSTYGNPSTVVIGQPLMRSQICLPPTTIDYGVTMTVKEQVPTTFLRIIGIQSLDLNVTSTSIVRGRNC